MVFSAVTHRNTEDKRKGSTKFLASYFSSVSSENEQNRIASLRSDPIKQEINEKLKLHSSSKFWSPETVSLCSHTHMLSLSPPTPHTYDGKKTPTCNTHGDVKYKSESILKDFFPSIKVCICKCHLASAGNVFSLVSHLPDKNCCTSNTAYENINANFKTRNWRWKGRSLPCREVVILTYAQTEVILYASVPWSTFITIHYLLLPACGMQTFRPMSLDLWGLFSTMDRNVLPDHQLPLAETEDQWLNQLLSQRTDWTQSWLVDIFMQTLS